MKFALICLLGIALAASSLPAAAEEAFDSASASEADRISYALGTQMGESLKQIGFDFNLDLLFKAARQVVEGKDTAMDEAAVRQAMTNLNKVVQERRGCTAFFAANKDKDGVVTTTSGLQYEVVEAGTGATPKAADTVSVHYTGTLLVDGTKFDSSVDRGQPAQFPVNGVIPGWTEALQLMQEGAKWTLYIPANLAYGPSGRPGIPGNSALKFEVELLEVVSGSDEVIIPSGGAS